MCILTSSTLADSEKQKTNPGFGCSDSLDICHRVLTSTDNVQQNRFQNINNIVWIPGQCKRKKELCWEMIATPRHLSEGEQWPSLCFQESTVYLLLGILPYTKTVQAVSRHFCCPCTAFYTACLYITVTTRQTWPLEADRPTKDGLGSASPFVSSQ